MKCPNCKENLKGIVPLSQEEWICVNEDCSLNMIELYGKTQKEVNLMALIYLNKSTKS
jgi:hypothetical protein